MTEPAERIERIRAGSDRLYRLDFLGRAWLAEYVSDVDTLVELWVTSSWGAGGKSRSWVPPTPQEGEATP